MVRVVDGEVTDRENGGERGTGKGGSAGDGFILVQGEGRALTAERLWMWSRTAGTRVHPPAIRRSRSDPGVRADSAMAR